MSGAFGGHHRGSLTGDHFAHAATSANFVAERRRSAELSLLQRNLQALTILRQRDIEEGRAD